MADLDQIATSIRSKHAAGALQKNLPSGSACYEQHASGEVKPCLECQGTGKIHESHLIGDLKGVPGADRVIERSCSHCGGCGITGDVSTKVWMRRLVVVDR
mmetsp:Transcript_2930/g.7033  ORF Transcript_2930/g.7033 Transcript_2930/m.7033 type:complete len:101 (+) Transcript_2930:277-579(+)